MLKEQIAELGRFREFKPGDTIYKQGDHDHDFYLILSGEFVLLPRSRCCHQPQQYFCFAPCHEGVVSVHHKKRQVTGLAGIAAAKAWTTRMLQRIHSSPNVKAAAAAALTRKPSAPSQQLKEMVWNAAASLEDWREAVSQDRYMLPPPETPPAEWEESIKNNKKCKLCVVLMF